jgi:hypothetical protein
MAWIKMIGLHDPELGPELGEAYQSLAQGVPPEYLIGGSDDVAGIIKTHSLAPAVLRGIFSGGLELINGPSPLTRREREMINTTVSAANRCFY